MVIQASGKEYHSVEIQLGTVLIPKEKLELTPSMEEGLKPETETELRNMGGELIQKAGIYLKLPQVAIASAQVLFQRFFYAKSFVSCDMQVAAKAAIWLASKIEENVRRVRDVINVFNFIECQRDGRPTDPIALDQKYWEIKREVIKMEHRILAELGFCVHVQHPHKIIIMYLDFIDRKSNKALVQTAWNYMNDSSRTPVFCQYQPETIACACIYLAARMLKIALPSEPHWYTIFNAKTVDVEAIAMTLLRLYSKQPRPYCEVTAEVDVLREAKKKLAKNLAAAATSQPGSPALNSPHGSSGLNSPNLAPNQPNSSEMARVAEIKKLIDEQAKDRSRSRSHGAGGSSRDHKERSRKSDKDRGSSGHSSRHHHHHHRDHHRSEHKSRRRSRSHSRERRERRSRRDKERKRSRD